jgi:DNA gyrase subunit B
VFDISKLRYHKVIIATDADVDGAHIRTLILTLLYRYFRPLIEGGFIYVAQPPLYKIKYGKEVGYYYSDAEKDAYFKKIGYEQADTEIKEGGEEEVVEEVESEEEETASKSKSMKKPFIQRYKGLGEMNADELGETTMDPAKRVLKQVRIEDIVATDRVIDVLMGTDVPSRKSFIQSNARAARLDI